MIDLNKITEQYQILSDSDRELLIEVRNKLTYLCSQIEVIMNQVALLESAAIEAINVADELNKALEKFKEFENVQRK